MSFEEWWKTKDYPARCKGNCKEAYEAGMKADVHTDNSQVIAELEAQIEKMKNCKNCKKLKKEKDGLLFCTVGSFYTNAFGKNCDKWEINEK